MTTNTLLTRAVIALGCLALPACGYGGTGVDLTPRYGLTVTPASRSTTLGTATSFTVDLASTYFAGPVTLSVSGAPASWAVVITPSATVNLSSGGTGAATVTVTIPSNGDAAPTGQTLTIDATASAGNHSAPAVLTVANEYIVPIALGTVAGAHWGALSGTTLMLRQGAVLTFTNNDTTAHTIHTNGGIPGFAHEPDPGMAPGQSYSSTLTGTGNDVFYCHVHAAADQVNLTVQ